MKTSSLPKPTPRFSSTLALLLLATVASAATLPVLEDSFGTRAKLTLIANRATALPVDATHRAFLFFDLRDLPAGATIRSARLRLFVPRVVRAGSGLELHNVTGTWDETLASPEPAFDAAILGTIAPASLRKKAFVTADLTAVAQAWLANPPGNEGLAITAVADALPKNVSSVTLGAKEGSGSGYPAELDVELDAAGPVNVGSSSLTIGSAQDPQHFDFRTDGNGFRMDRVSAGNITPIFTSNFATNDIRIGFGGALNLLSNGSVRVDGAFALEATTVTTSFNANPNTCVFFCNTINNNITITLPDVSGTLGRIYLIKKTSANNTLTIATTGAATIEGAASLILAANNAFRFLISNGINWFVISQ
jgi:hypothetical protein